MHAAIACSLLFFVFFIGSSLILFFYATHNASLRLGSIGQTLITHSTARHAYRSTQWCQRNAEDVMCNAERWYSLYPLNFHWAVLRCKRVCVRATDSTECVIVIILICLVLFCWCFVCFCCCRSSSGSCVCVRLWDYERSTFAAAHTLASE